MCVQCMMGATTALTGAASLRAWLAAKSFMWLSPRRMRAVSIATLAAGVVGSSAGLSGSS